MKKPVLQRRGPHPSSVKSPIPRARTIGWHVIASGVFALLITATLGLLEQRSPSADTRDEHRAAQTAVAQIAHIEPPPVIESQAWLPPEVAQRPKVLLTEQPLQQQPPEATAVLNDTASPSPALQYVKLASDGPILERVRKPQKQLQGASTKALPTSAQVAESSSPSPAAPTAGPDPERGG
jgi:hypothetical protein